MYHYIYLSPLHKDSLTPLRTTYQLAGLPISPLFVDQFGRSLQFYSLEFNKEAIYDG